MYGKLPWPFYGHTGVTVLSSDSLLIPSSCCNEINANVMSINKSHTSSFNLSALMSFQITISACLVILIPVVHTQ